MANGMSGTVKFLLGSLVGAVAGMLFAPQSGEKTREMLRNRSEMLQDQLSQTAMGTQAKAKHLTEQARDRVREMTGREMAKPSPMITPALMSGLLFGALVGATAGLLFAPRPGRQTRAMIREKSMELKDQVSQAVSSAASQAEQMSQEYSHRGEGG